MTIRLTSADDRVRMNLVTDRLEIEGSRKDCTSIFTGRPGFDTRLWLYDYHVFRVEVNPEPFGSFSC